MAKHTSVLKTLDQAALATVIGGEDRCAGHVADVAFVKAPLDRVRKKWGAAPPVFPRGQITAEQLGEYERHASAYGSSLRQGQKLEGAERMLNDCRNGKFYF